MYNDDFSREQATLRWEIQSKILGIRKRMENEQKGQSSRPKDFDPSILYSHMEMPQ